MKFKEGDIIQNIKPYDGEPEMLITKEDASRQEYHCTAIEDGELLWQSIEGEEDMDCYKKVS
jgi:hypothetical protein